MAGDRIEYTLGVGVEIKNTADQVRILQDTLNKENFSIKMVTPDVNIGKADEIFERLKKEYKEVTEIAVDYKTVVDDTGKTIGKFADSISFKGVGAMGELRKHQEKLNEGMADFGKKMKVFNDYSLNADKAKASAKNLGDEQKKSVEGTAEKLQAAIQKWNEHAEKLNLNEKEAKELEAEIERLNKELQVNQAETKTSANAMQSFGLRLANAIKQTGAYTVALRASRLAQQELRKAVSYSVELDTEMTKIKVLQVEGAKTEAQINGLAKSFNNLAKEMAISTLEVARGSTEWLRQGKTVAETQELLRSTVMLSKLGAIDTANATEKLTATLNAFNLEAKDAELIVDKLVAVDNIAATSVNELATAMQYSASIASQSGVSFDQLTSYIAVISETTRQSAQTIGQAFKTIFSRMQTLREGKIDEDGIGINKVEDALYRVGIRLRDEEGQFRNFGTVLEELGAIWQSLNGTMEQSNIAGALGGTRQVNLIYALLNNMNDALGFQEEQAKATGLATERYGIYLDSVQAKIDKFKATLEGLYQSLISSDLIKWFIDFGQSILDSIEKAGGLQTVIKWVLGIVGVLKGVPAILKTIKGLQVATNLAKVALSMGSVAGQGMKVTGMLSGLLKGLKLTGASAEKTAIVQGLLNASYEGGNKGLAQYILTQAGLIPATNAVTGATLGFGAALQAALGPIALVTLAIGALVGAYVLIQKEMDRRNVFKSAEKIQEIETEIKAVEEKKKSAKELLDIEKRQQKELNQAKYNTEEYEIALSNLIDTHKKLIEIYPELGAGMDAQGKLTDDAIVKVKELTAAEERLIKDRKEAQQQIAAKALFNKSTLTTQGLDTFNENDLYMGMFSTTTEDHTARAISKMSANWNAYAHESRKAIGDTTKDMVKAVKKLDEFNASLDAVVENYNNLSEEQQKHYRDYLIDYAKYYVEDAEAVQKILDRLYNSSPFKPYTMDTGDEDLIERLKNTSPAEFEIDDPYKKLYSESIPKAIEGLDLLYDAINKTFIPPEDETRLNELFKGGGVQIEYMTNKLYIMEDGVKRYISTTEDFIGVIAEHIDGWEDLDQEQKDYIISALLAHEAMRKGKGEVDDFTKSIDTLAKTMEEQNKNGEISADSVLTLISINREYADMIEYVDGKYILSNESLSNAILLEYNKAEAEQYAMAITGQNSEVIGYLTQASIAASEGNYLLMASSLEAAAAASDSIPNLEAYAEILAQIAKIANTMREKVTIPRGGSAGAKKEDPRIKETEKLIKGLEKQIDAHKKEIDLHKKEIDIIKAAQKAYADWIDQKKKSLELAKNEADYYKDQEERLKSLAKLEKELAVIKLDNSPEARAKALELEEQIHEKRKEIEENSEERRHELQIRALEELKDAFDNASEEQIKGIQTIIDGIEEIIKGIQEQIKEQREFIQELREQGRDGGGGNDTYRRTGGSGKSLLQDIQEGVDQHRNKNRGSNQEELGSPVSQKILETQGDHLGGAKDMRSAYDTDKNVYAPQTGVVITAGDSGNGYGNTVAIRNADGRIVSISHLGDVGNLKPGMEINKGDIMGSIDIDTWTGDGTGEHLHVATFQEMNGVVEQTTTHLSNFKHNIEYANSTIPDGTMALVNAFEKSTTLLAYTGYMYNGKVTEEANKFKDAAGLTNEQMILLSEALKSGAVNADADISTVLNNLSAFGIKVNLTGRELFNFQNFLKQLQKDKTTKLSNTRITPEKINAKSRGGIDTSVEMIMHEGGLVDDKHTKAYKGDLKSNEVFAKLLKGEYVATEGQMEHFLSQTLPKMMGTPKVNTQSTSVPITMNMPINVEGNMDKSAIADIEVIANRAVEKINRQVASMGHIRTSNQFIS